MIPVQWKKRAVCKENQSITSSSCKKDVLASHAHLKAATLRWGQHVNEALKVNLEELAGHCEVCGITLNCKEQFQQHVQGRKHKSRLQMVPHQLSFSHSSWLQ